MRTVCKKDMCAGCGVCVESCSKKAIHLIEDIQAYNAVIDEGKCVDCGRCSKICPKNNPSEFRTPIEWYQGWSLDEKIRANSSSGGFASAIAKAFIEDDGVVCTCKFSKGGFGFQFIYNTKDLMTTAGSKYVKSSPKGCYREVLSKLKSGHKVLFIGLPCQVSAVLNYVRGNWEENLYTIDLICHGTPSAQLLDMYVQQKGVDIRGATKVSFRNKTNYGLQVDHSSVEDYCQDNYTTAFLSSISYTENCYCCDYAQRKRVSDITLGDSWDSDLPSEEAKKGISLALCQTPKGKMLLEKADLCLHPVDIQRAIVANHQLMHPSEKPPKRDFFIRKIKDGKSFDQIMFMIEPRRELKKIAKRILKRKY